MAADDFSNPGQDNTSEQTQPADSGQTDLNELHLTNATRRRREEEEIQDGQANNRDADQDETSGNLHYGSGRDINLLNDPEPDRNAFGTEVDIAPKVEAPLPGAVIDPELGDGVTARRQPAPRQRSSTRASMQRPDSRAVIPVLR